MRHLTLHAAVAVTVFLAGVQEQSLAQYIVSEAKTSAGPALTTFNGTTVVAWAGVSGPAHKVAYTTTAQNTGLGSPPTGWSPQQFVCDACTTAAPALGATGGSLYLAMRGASANPADNIYYSVWPASSTKGFSTTLTELCAGTTCPQTTASPALAGSGSALYAAWTTASDTINFAILSSGSWSIAPAPDVSTNPPAPNTGPALAVYNDLLYMAWVTACDAIVYATLPLSSGALWSPAARIAGAKSNAAPTFGIRYQPPHAGLSSSTLNLAWTAASTAGYVIDMAEWTGLAWSTASTISPLAGPMESFSPALNGFINDTTVPCAPLYFNFNVAYTMALAHEGEIGLNEASVTGTPPKGCKPM
jgi:hypothetical protein